MGRVWRFGWAIPGALLLFLAGLIEIIRIGPRKASIVFRCVSEALKMAGELTR